MSRVRIIFLNRSCAQLHTLSLSYLLLRLAPTSYIPTTATAYLVERVINCHNSCTLSVTLLLETLEQNAPLARAFLSMFVSSRLAPPCLSAILAARSTRRLLCARAMSIFLLNEVVLSKLLVLTQPTMTGTEVWWMS